ncbi:MAG: DUF5018 domain-containing protein [Prevotellaceae bacterium]|jgi:hypothetical protein|nr:DUF5018 domain-containing protein [Prevotellaceae bacterium]
MKKIFFTSLFLLIYSAVNALDSASIAITKFELPGQIGATSIDTLSGDIFLSVQDGTNVKTLTPVIEAKGKSVTLLWNKGNDAQCPHIYASTAHNGSVKEYRVHYGFIAIEQPEFHFMEGYDAVMGITSGVVTTGGASTSQNHGLYGSGSKCFSFVKTAANNNCDGKTITTPVVNTAGVLRFWVKGSSRVTATSFKVEKITGGVTSLLDSFPQPHGNEWTEVVVVVNDLSPAVQLRITTYDCHIGSGTLYIDDLSLTPFAGSNKPVIANVKTTPQYPDATAKTAITAEITDSDDAVVSAKMLWGKEKDKLVNAIAMSKISGNIYKSGKIQSRYGDAIYYKIIAFDTYFVSDTTPLLHFVTLRGYPHVETLESANLAAGFGSGSFTGNAATWSYSNAKSVTLNGKAVALGSNGSISASPAGGALFMRFDYSGSSAANLEIQVNGVKAAEVTADLEATTGDVKVNAPEGSTLRIVNKSTSEIAIDNIRWDDFEALTITAQPVDMQLYPALPDSGAVRFAGVVNNPQVTQITLSAYANQTLYRKISKTVTPENGVGGFDLSVNIPAQPINFEFRYETNLTSAEETLARNVVAGDVYIISGQSNAVSSGTGTPADSLSDFFRAFGRMYKDGAYNAEEATWGKANAKGASYNADYYVGYAGNVLSRNILNRQNRPSLILNIAVGGTSIEQNLPNALDHYDLNTIYGRGLYRAQQAGVCEHVKAIIWVQGEANQNGTYAEYPAKFAALRSAWKADYSSLQKIYVGQLNTGCGTGAYGSEMREVQRRLQDTFDDVEVMSHVGIPIRHDSCHYTPEGYELLYGRYYDLIAHDFYGAQKSLIKPPNVQKVFFVNQSRDTIAVKFDQKIVIPQPVYGREMKNYFYDDADRSIAAATLESYEYDSSVLLITANNPITATTLTYGPDAYVKSAYTGADTLYTGPWLTNARGISALTFNRVNIGREDLTGELPQKEPKSSECSIRSLKIGSSNGVIQGDTIRVRNLPADADLSALIPVILISEKASILPGSGVAQDFRNPVAYTVTAEDGVSQKRYTVVAAKKDDANTGMEKTLSKEPVIYPNPFTNDVHIDTPDDVAQVDVFDSGGGLKLSVKNVSSKKINFDKLPGGTYFVRITLNGGASRAIQVVKK